MRYSDSTVLSIYLSGQYILSDRIFEVNTLLIIIIVILIIIIICGAR